MSQFVKKMKKSQLRKKLLPMISILSILSTLILIPKIDVQAANYPATTSFTYNYQGYDFQFYFSGEVDSPQDYRFDDSVLDFVIQKSGEGLNLAIAAETTANINFTDSPFLYIVYSLYHNWMVATSWFQSPWLDSSKLYGFSFEFTGVDNNYPGSGEYGPAYGWRFTGWASEVLDLVLDEQGFIYGTHPIGNYTFSEDQRDFGIWSIHQYEAQDGEFWVPENNSSSIQSMKPPYFIGKELHFFVYSNGDVIEYIYPDFSNTLMSYVTHNSQFAYVSFCDSKYQSNNSNQKLLNANSLQEVSVAYSRSNQFTYNGISYSGYSKMYHYGNLAPSWNLSMVAPLYLYYDRDRANLGSVSGAADYVSNNSIHQNACALLFLTSLSTSPLPDPIVLPVDDPIPVSNIDPDPVVFDPDPGEDPDPVPGIDYPVDPPLPWPIPEIPTIVSGNDDIWPDLNLTFGLEDGLLDLTGNLSNFEWPQFSGLIGNFINALIWVSTIMTTLYDGTGFSVLFNVLAVFFIAAALFGLYKWWNK